ncbi:hypothetical protein BA059_04985 [Mycolicibacterium sp. (ex Dasyatis americana)]|uniref:SDR family NAD(P)-dependent oxidoreductase n=1 Tax=Mycobacterium sp. DBP42 TaxID=2545267 RepID=UPI00087334A8|nr:SDR family NAD(P)-dependent oxidoreductase [Mycobacterium sp. DBP42]OFB42567.1 hypothetical protein BA059_04985 [Mycolicibacterium sp. (ex Dasyatis americana)]TMS50380.1 SDR family NAD(P)-dependent oxidoreductase [Mycobacterium sp. DBP42]
MIETRRARGSWIAGTVAVVTGGARGIGAATAAALERRGATVATIDLDYGSGRPHGQQFVADVRDRRALRACLQRIRHRYGAIDIVVANAGIAPAVAALWDLPASDFEDIIETNVLGVYNTIATTLPYVLASQGHITVVSSVAAALPGPGSAAYMASKAAIEQLGRTLRMELGGTAASTTLVYLGMVDTEMARSLDDDRRGQLLAKRVPRMLRHPISAACAAESLVDAVHRRTPRVVLPKRWMPYLWSRGLINPVLDTAVARDPAVQAALAADAGDRAPRRPTAPVRARTSGAKNRRA